MILIALLFGLLIFVTNEAVDWLLLHRHEPGRDIIEVSDIFAGVVAAGLFLRLLLYEQERRAALRRRLEIIAEMNHHVRNGLQAISLSSYSAADEAQLSIIREGMNRIQWALKEILPKL